MTSAKWVALWLLGSAAIWPFHRSPPRTPAPPPSYAEGARLYHEACISCHGPRGNGEAFVRMPDGSLAPALNQLTGSSASLDSIESIVRDGKEQMPAFKQTMTPSQIRSVALYVASLNSKVGVSAPASDSIP
ncbi:MAG: cytochrome c [Thermaerobacter sp.]|nr:cytochrome c [Thermaerobacter sp.]